MKNWKFALLGTAALAMVPAVTSAAFTNYTGLDGGGWTVDYQLHITNSSSFGGGVPYDTNNSASILPGSFNRVAYVLEVQSGAGPTQYVFASFDPQSGVASLLGVPTFPSGEIYQQNVGNLHVLSGGGAPVTSGIYPNGGNIEFWPNDYGTNNAAGVPGASNSTYDTGDERSTGGSYGSMQIHNHDPNLGGNQVLIAFNQWNGGGGELGLGNQVGGSGHPDWTFSGNAGSYTVKDLQVLVHPIPEPASLSLLGLGAAGLIARRRRA